ncbi:MAG TPA: RNA polymerase sigma-70 factor [Bacteroidales bacterium]|nr:RNA polymerase sigma-70 factor [Bacteroidales bacterium]
MDEKNLLLAIKNDDPEAFKKLYLKYRLKLYYFAFRFLRNKADSEEVVQEVFVRVWNIRKQINEALSFNSYLFTITKNYIFNQKRDKINHESFLNLLLPFCSESENTTEDTIISNDLESHIQKAIEDLPPQRKLVFKKSREQGLTYPQIASELNISEKTVESHIRLAIKWIKTHTR